MPLHGLISAEEVYEDQLGERLVLLEHGTNQGVGGAIASGYKWCRDHEIDAVAAVS